jgi:predicted negative regulator of RcsB-dependent stress response
MVARKNCTLIYDMQTQDAPAEIIFKLWPWVEANGKRLAIGAGAIIILVGIYFFLQTEREQNEVNAGDALTTLLATAPTGGPESSAAALTQLAAKYSGTQAALRAQLQGAAMYYSVGDYTNAQAEFHKFLAMSSGGQQAAIAQLGIATSLEAQGKMDDAVAAYQKVVSGYSSSPCAAQAGYALGRMAESQGKLAEALSDYQGVVQAAKEGRTAGSLPQLASQAATQIQARLESQKPAAAPATVPNTSIPSLTPISK